MADARRNATICQDIVEGIREGRSPLVLTERVDHLKELASLLADAALDVVSLRGGMTPKALSSELDRIGDGERRRWYLPPADSSARGSTKLISIRCS